MLIAMVPVVNRKSAPSDLSIFVLCAQYSTPHLIELILMLGVAVARKR